MCVKYIEKKRKVTSKQGENEEKFDIVLIRK